MQPLELSLKIGCCSHFPSFLIIFSLFTRLNLYLTVYQLPFTSADKIPQVFFEVRVPAPVQRSKKRKRETRKYRSVSYSIIDKKKDPERKSVVIYFYCIGRGFRIQSISIKIQSTIVSLFTEIHLSIFRNIVAFASSVSLKMYQAPSARPNFMTPIFYPSDPPQTMSVLGDLTEFYRKSSKSSSPALALNSTKIE